MMDGATLSKIAHELRTPLTLINSTLQMIESQLPQMKELKYWIQLNEDFKDMTELVSSLTTFQCSTGDYPDEVDLYHMLTSLRDGFLLDKLGRGVSIELDTEPDAKETAMHFHCDRVQLKQVCTNLLKNALEATLGQEERNVRLNLTTSHVPMPEDETDIHFLCISVRDNGPGIPKEIMPKLYTPFVSGKRSGTGLGLSIVSNIIASHNGYIDVESTEAGTTFLVYLPYIL